MIAFDRTKQQAIWMFSEGQLGTLALVAGDLELLCAG